MRPLISDANKLLFPVSSTDLHTQLINCDWIFQGGVVIGGDAAAANGNGDAGVADVAAPQVEEEPADGLANPVVGGGGGDALGGGLGAAHQALLQRDGPTGK